MAKYRCALPSAQFFVCCTEDVSDLADPIRGRGMLCDSRELLDKVKDRREGALGLPELWELPETQIGC